MSKQSKKAGKGKSQKVVDKMVEDIVDEDEEEDDEDEIDIQNSQLNKFLSSKPSSGGQKKGGKDKGNVQRMKYSEFTEIVKGERLWNEMDKSVETLKTYYINQLRVRSVGSLDELEIELEGDVYPLNELATISKKDSKRLIIDASAFPDSAKNIMKAIVNSGMNLNPQQDGLFIFVPIPKVTTQHREQLVDGAKKKLTETKTTLRGIQNNYQRKLGEDELADKVTKEDARAAQETIRQITEFFQAQGDQLFAAKSKELMGK